MATLEVHDSQGRVQFVEVTRDHPILFGTSSACDVVLQGEFIRPVHGRIRWKSDKFKVEASPDAEFVLINGHKMTTGSIRQGDEITVGDCRMFLIRVEEDLGDSKRANSPAKDDRTRVAPPRAVPSRSSSRQGGRPADRDEPPMLERDDWLNAVRTAGGKEPGIAPAEAPLRRGFARGRLEEAELEEVEARTRKPGGGFNALARLKSLRGTMAPGQERILTSPLVIGLVVSLVILVGLGFWLKSIIASTIASRTFDRAVQNFDDGDYRTAMRDFDSFLKDNPKDSAPARHRCCDRSRTCDSMSRSKGARGRRPSRRRTRWSTR